MTDTNFTTAELKTESNIGKRILAGFIDYLLIYVLILTFFFTFGETNTDGEYIISGLSVLIQVFIWFIITVGIEIGFGATLGNSIVGLRAIPINGINRRLTFGESFIRHLLDPIDMFLFGLVGIISINNSERNQRVGDLMAKTIVVSSKYLAEIKME